MSLTPGQRIGPYEVTGPLGAGGMGEVWRAHDPRLGRDVAIKVLPAALASDPERRARFERECRLLASLNHPHVASVLGLEDAGGAPALVMELVEGPTLAERIDQGGVLPLVEALGVARQIAEAVEYAHERGIVHRDLKPGNVKLTPEGAVKVLDFGLAKALALDDSATSSPQLTQSPTRTAGTQAGVLLGTAAYMSPEQARGKPVDRRADIWAFGVVLYEMLTGRQMFAGETVSDTIARILERPPDWGALPGRTPRRVRELLQRCLEKDAKQRLRDIGDARIEIETALGALASGVSDAPAGESPRAGALRIAGVVVAIVAALVAGYLLRGGLRGGAARAAPLRLSAVAPDDLVLLTMVFGKGNDRALYASGTPRGAEARSSGAIYRRAEDDFEWRKVPGTDGKLSWDQSMDGHWFYVLRPIAEGARQNELVRVPVDGSAPPAELQRWDENIGSWDVLPDGRIVVVERGTKRFRTFAPGSMAAAEWKPIQFDRTLGGLDLEESLDDGKAVLTVAKYYGANGWTESASVLDLESGKVSILEENTGSPRILPEGKLVMTRGGALLAAPWDARLHRLRSRPVSVMEGLRTGLSWGHSEVRTSPRGDVGIVLGGSMSEKRTITIADAEGRMEPWNSEQRAFEQHPEVSPDGRLVAALGLPPGTWTYEVLLLERGRPGVRRFARAESLDCAFPSFSPDSRWLAWALQGSDSTDGIYVQPLDGSVPARRVVAARSLTDADMTDDWYPEGRALLVTTIKQRRTWLRRVDLSRDPTATSDVVSEAFNVSAGRLSPDGRRIAYESYERGEPEIVVAALGPDGRAGDPVPVSRGYGVRAQWADGATILWSTRAKVVMAARVSPALEVSAPEKRADLSPWITSEEDFAALPGGGIVFIRKADGEDEIRRFDVLIGYGREVDRALRRARGGTR